MQKRETAPIRAFLFDLDGVVFDTEPQYTRFWQEQCRIYHPEVPGLEQTIKGQSLTEIFGTYFSDVKEQWPLMTQRLEAFEKQMDFAFVAGFEAFYEAAKAAGMATAIVTSSNRAKMEAVYRQHPGFPNRFEAVLTAEDFSQGKPHPECYLKAAALLGCKPEEALVFEDSFNGLRAGRSAGMRVVGLSTTNSPEAIRPLADVVIADYAALAPSALLPMVASRQ